MITKEILIKEHEICNNMKERIESALSSCKSGSLYTKRQHGKCRLHMFANGKETYIPAHSLDIVESILRGYILKDWLDQINDSVAALDSFSHDHIPVYDIISRRDTDRINFKITGMINDLPDAVAWMFTPENIETIRNDLLSELFYDVDTDKDISDWLMEPYDPNPYLPESRIHISPSGTRVRSKSELLIAAALEYRGIAYKYECPLQMDGFICYPDFTIKRRSDGKMIIWEHFGMMDDDDYKEKAQFKIMNYARNDYIAFDNFIATYDRDGSIDMSVIERLCSCMLE